MKRPDKLLDRDPEEITIAYNQLWAWCHELEARLDNCLEHSQKLQTALKAILDDVSHNEDFYCRWCGDVIENGGIHNDDCLWKQAKEVLLIKKAINEPLSPAQLLATRPEVDVVAPRIIGVEDID